MKVVLPVVKHLEEPILVTNDGDNGALVVAAVHEGVVAPAQVCSDYGHSQECQSSQTSN